MSVESFTVLQLHAGSGSPAATASRRLTPARDGARDNRRYPLSHRRAELRREREALEGRAGRVGSRMQELRAEVGPRPAA